MVSYFKFIYSCIFKSNVENGQKWCFLFGVTAPVLEIADEDEFSASSCSRFRFWKEMCRERSLKGKLVSLPMGTGNNLLQTQSLVLSASLSEKLEDCDLTNPFLKHKIADTYGTNCLAFRISNERCNFISSTKSDGCGTVLKPSNRGH